MNWKKEGLFFCPKGEYPWMLSHASLPIADFVEDDIFRIYFSSRNSQNYSSIGYIEIDLKSPKNILTISENPIISPGKLGSFDDTGAMTASIVTHEAKKYLYYIGWNQSTTVPFRWSIGLAISTDDGISFQKFSEGPIMDRNYIDPYFVSSPTVIKEGNIWKMWYISGISWQKTDEKLYIPYNIRYAESSDGIHWNRNGKFCLDFKNSKETRIGRASVLKTDNKYQIWYSYAASSYRIGYAESDNGISWIRKDNLAGIDVSKSGWDSQMIEYSYVFKHKDEMYMLYNGNNYGETGIGLAKLIFN